MTVFFDGTRHGVLFEKAGILRTLFATCTRITAEDLEQSTTLGNLRSQLETAIAAIACEHSCVARVLPFLGNAMEMLSQTVSLRLGNATIPWNETHYIVQIKVAPPEEEGEDGATAPGDSNSSAGKESKKGNDGKTEQQESSIAQKVSQRKISLGLEDIAPTSPFAAAADLSRRTDVVHPEKFRTCLRVLFICHVGSCPCLLDITFCYSSLIRFAGDEKLA